MPTSAAEELRRVREQNAARRREFAEGLAVLVEHGPRVGVHVTEMTEHSSHLNFDMATLKLQIYDPEVFTALAATVKGMRAKQLLEQTQDPDA